MRRQGAERRGEHGGRPASPRGPHAPRSATSAASRAAGSAVAGHPHRHDAGGVAERPGLALCPPRHRHRDDELVDGLAASGEQELDQGPGHGRDHDVVDAGAVSLRRRLDLRQVGGGELEPPAGAGAAQQAAPVREPGAAQPSSPAPPTSRRADPGAERSPRSRACQASRASTRQPGRAAGVARRGAEHAGRGSSDRVSGPAAVTRVGGTVPVTEVAGAVGQRPEHGEPAHAVGERVVCGHGDPGDEPLGVEQQASPPERSARSSRVVTSSAVASSRARGTLSPGPPTSSSP